MPERPTRYLLSGIGRRAWTTYLPKLAECKEAHRLVAVVDPDPARLAEFRGRWPETVLLGDQFDAVLAQAEPDWVIVTAPDHAHAEQIVAALAVDVSVLTEKPMVLNTPEAILVLDAERNSAAEVRVAHNLRYLNLHVVVKKLVLGGHIGRVTQLSFWYHLRPGHGQSYFLRWHRRTAWSGGLQITKSCHHFDLLNWWLGDLPAQVFSHTERNHFLPGRDIPADADIADTISALIRYRRGAVVSYLLSASSPWEGYELRIHGTAGLLTVVYQVTPLTDQAMPESFLVEVFPHDGPGEIVNVPREAGRHSGADDRMLASLFSGASDDNDYLHQAATALDGAYAVALGDTVTRAAAEGHHAAVPDFHGRECR